MACERSKRRWSWSRSGHDPLDAAIEGVAIVEADPKDHSVGYGGLPNEDGVVELDAAVMHGPTHGGGSVASIRNIMHPAAVARLVMQRYPALPAGRRGRAAVRRRPRLPRDQPADRRGPADLAALEGNPRPQGRLAAAPRRKSGRLHSRVRRPTASPARSIARCSTPTATWAAPRRPRACRGRSPAASAIRRSWGRACILDNEVGSAGSTGVGELNLLNLSSALIVEGMRRGLHPKDAIMEVCKTIATASTRDPKRRRPDGRVGNVSFYAISKDGKFAGGSIYPGGKMAVHDGDSARIVACDPLFER